MAQPCGVSYHTQCIRVGTPFHTRQLKNRGLQSPLVKEWPNFICEGCTVRAMVDRELHGKEDFVLLVLERMRLIDVAHRWAPRTHEKYQQKLTYLRSFQDRFPGLCILRTDNIKRPPTSVDIPLMWAEEAYSLRPGREDDANVKFGTIRTLRSAMSHFESINALHAGRPMFLDQQNRLIHQDCRITDGAAHSFFTTGLGARVGTETKPAIALLMRHVQAMDKYYLSQYRKATNPASQRKWALAGLLNVVFWLGWLRSQETFQLKWTSVTVVDPKDGPTVDLPPNVGVCFLDLGPSTKTSRGVNAKVVISYQSLSGLSCGRWFKRAFAASGGSDMANDHRYIFTHASGKLWSSRYYRHHFLYPSLERLRQEGDPFLRAFSDTPGNSIPEKFWSMHTYRRGARTHATKGSKKDSRRANIHQVYEHGRWRRRRAGEAIDKQYDEWTIQDRVQITLFCH
jgi:hypothetical protein